MTSVLNSVVGCKWFEMGRKEEMRLNTVQRISIFNLNIFQSKAKMKLNTAKLKVVCTNIMFMYFVESTTSICVSAHL